MKQGIPSSARDHLAKQAAPGEHPSADLLNAFVEQSLSAAKKERVTAHLAACSECREVVFLAGAAAGEEDQSAALTHPDAGWHRWLSWKWVVPAVAALAIAAGVTLQYERANRAHPAAPAIIAMNRAAPAPQGSTTHYEQQNAPATPDIVIDQTKKAVPAQPPSSRGDKKLDELSAAQAYLSPKRDSTAVGGNLPDAFYSSAAAPTDAVKFTPPGVAGQPNAPANEAKARTVVTKPSSSGKTELAASSNLAAPAPVPDSGAKVLRKSKAAAAGIAGGPSEIAAAKQAQQAVQQHQAQNAAAEADAGPLAKTVTVPFSSWQITPDGHLQRSTPSGEWTPVLADQPVSFRSVALVGDDVWAGANDGALFHSTDGGEQWSKVPISPDEHGAIVSIRFDNTSEGVVTTAAGAHWSTRDAGQTWQKRY